MEKAMVVILFLVGVTLVVVAIVALFKNAGGDQKGSFEMDGVRLSGSGAPIVFLLIGASLAFGSLRWYDSLSRNQALTERLTAKTKILVQAQEQNSKMQAVLAEQESVMKAFRAEIPPDLVQKYANLEKKPDNP